MRNFIIYIYKNSKIGYLLIYPAKFLYDIYRFHFMSEKIFIKRTFKKNIGYRLNLKNPRTFNEKIQWLKLNERTSLHTVCADKLKVREYIKEKIGEDYLIPLLYESDNPIDIVPNNLPDIPHIIKVNHSSKGEVIVKDKTKIDYRKIQQEFKRKIKDNLYYKTKEWQYKHIKPRIMVEKLLLDEESNIPIDYKFHCFNGKLAFIQADIDRFTDHKRNLYDTDWNFIDCRWIYKNAISIEEPCMFKKMKILAEIIAKDFCYIRVDLYNIGNDIYFGELTFHPGSGFERFIPPQWDMIFGDQLTL